MTEGNRAIHLGKRLPAAFGFNQSYFANQSGNVFASDASSSRKLGIRRQGAHERSPGKIPGREGANNAVLRRSEGMKVGDMGGHLAIEEVSYLLGELLG